MESDVPGMLGGDGDIAAHMASRSTAYRSYWGGELLFVSSMKNPGDKMYQHHRHGHGRCDVDAPKNNGPFIVRGSVRGCPFSRGR